MGLPLLSVAVITYKQEKTLSQTLESILSQNIEFPYEIVIGEDNSPDNTKSIVEEYALKYPDIIKPLYNNPNLGVIKNYFNVIRHCSGRYIMECAGDDYWLPGKVSTQVAFMEKNPTVGMCYGLAKNWIEDKQQFDSSVAGAKCECYSEIFMGNSIPALSVCFRRALMEKYITDVKPEEQNWRMEDLPCWLWFSKESKIKFFPKEFGVYRMQSESESHFVDDNKMKLYEESCYAVRQFYAKKFNTPELLSQYVAHWGFINAWNNKNSEQLIKNWKNLCLKDKSIKNYVKYILARIGRV